MLSDVSTQDNSNNSDEYFYPSNYKVYTQLHRVSFDLYRTVTKYGEQMRRRQTVTEIPIEWVE